MPYRIIPLITDQYYHIFNRGSNRQPIFLGKRDYQRGLESLKFYSLGKPELRFSKYLLLKKKDRIEYLKKLKEKRNNKGLVEFVAFCLMPNHFHFLLKQKQEEGISIFMSHFQNSYTRYFNTRHKRTGHLLGGQFKAVLIETDEQLLHLTRYIHLNPYTSYIVKKLSKLEDFSWSSLHEYIGKSSGAENDNEHFCQKENIFVNFRDNKDYLEFVFDNADYQRKLERIKHLVLED